MQSEIRLRRCGQNFKSALERLPTFALWVYPAHKKTAATRKQVAATMIAQGVLFLFIHKFCLQISKLFVVYANSVYNGLD